MDFSREINRLLLGLLAAFMITGMAATYWALVGQEDILNREDNPRRVEAEEAILRGGLYDRDIILLAESIPDDVGRAIRTYLHPEMNSALGYFSFRYGVGGAEAAFDPILRGDTQPRDFSTYFEQGALHRPQEGVDVQLTLSLDIQRALIEAMGEHTGAAVVLSVPDGEVLALASLPTFDPNTLDADWDTLIAAPGKPFFNRALQGVYQPGGMLQTPLLAAVLLTNRSLDTLTADANVPVQAGTTRLICAATTPRSDFDYRAAYAYSCPRPFALLAEALGEKNVQNIFAAFHLSQPPELVGFVAQIPPDVEATSEVTAEVTPEFTPDPDPATAFIENALGQGRQTINPLGMASIVAAMLDDGNAPMPYAIRAVRPPASDNWQDARPSLVPVPMITAPVARQMSELMISNVQAGAAQPAAQPDLIVGGHAALAYSGEGTQAWFIGFVRLEGNRSVVIAIVLEDSTDPGEAAIMGGTVLKSAYDALRTGGTN